MYRDAPMGRCRLPVRILVTAASVAFATRVARGMGDAGIGADTAIGLGAAVQAILERPYALVIARAARVDEASIFLRSVRMAAPETEAIVVSHDAAVRSKLAAFDAGACDYVVEPFSIAELAARARIHLRRARTQSRFAIGSGELELDLMHRQVRIGDRRLDLTGRESMILGRLMQSPGQIVARDELARFVWDGATAPNTLDATVARLRRKVGDDVRIVTIRGVGHYIEAGAGAHPRAPGRARRGAPSVPAAAAR